MEQVTFDALGATVRGTLPEPLGRPARPAAVICPGGAYQWISAREGEPVAREFLARGFQTFVVEYAVGEQARDFLPLRQLAQAVHAVRTRSGAWHTDPGAVAVVGFSAGGHLAASLGALWQDPGLGLPPDCRPDALVLGYPVLSTGAYAHEASARTVSGGDAAVRAKLHIPDHVTPDFPPAFVWHGGEDESVPPENSLLLAWRLREAGVPVELHLFGTGGHGLAACTREVGTPDAVCRTWVPLCMRWLCGRFSYEP